MTTGTLKIHSENLLPIIKKWLYSDRDIFVRELVSNACDAIGKVKILREKEGYSCRDEEFRIDITVDAENKKLIITDTGIGMDAGEVEKYIAQLAFSGAEEFVKKYETTGEDKERVIGHFGLGFYSAFMVSSRVDINTLSYREGSESAFWTSDGSTEYVIDKGSRKERGTEITLHIDKENEEFLDPVRIREILNRYSLYLPHPIYLNGSRINEREPLWLKAPAECSDKDYLDFYRHLYPMEEAPLFWIHLNVDYPFHLQGILYFPKLKKNMDFRKNTIKLFCNRVFVTDHCRDLIPEYLTMLQGCIDSPDIPLNVSRSSLQMDRTVRQLASHVSKKVSDRLSSLCKTDKEKFIVCWKDVEVIVKLGVLQDDKFYDRVKNCLIWQNLEGDWLTVEEYKEKNASRIKDTIYYHSGEEGDDHLIDLYKEKKIEVLKASSPIDGHLMSFLEGKLAPCRFVRIDGELTEAIMDPSKENTLLDQDGKTIGGRLASLIETLLGKDSPEVEAKSLAKAEIPAFLLIDEQARRLRDFMRMNHPEGAGMTGPMKYKLVVNTNSPLIAAVEKLHAAQPELAKQVMIQVYNLAKLSQKEIDGKEIGLFTRQMASLLEALTEKLS